MKLYFRPDDSRDSKRGVVYANVDGIIIEIIVLNHEIFIPEFWFVTITSGDAKSVSKIYKYTEAEVMSGILTCFLLFESDSWDCRYERDKLRFFVTV